MQKYGILEDGNLLQSSKHREGYKPIEHAVIPIDFDQTTHYISQSDPVEKDDCIYIGIEINVLVIEEDEEFDEDIL